jgi:recombinational DNA repair ATPase RecF
MPWKIVPADLKQGHTHASMHRLYVEAEAHASYVHGQRQRAHYLKSRDALISRSIMEIRMEIVAVISKRLPSCCGPLLAEVQAMLKDFSEKLSVSSEDVQHALKKAFTDGMKQSAALEDTHRQEVQVFFADIVRQDAVFRRVWF